MSQNYQHIQTMRIEDLAGGDKEFLNEIISIFLAQIPDFVSKMKTALENEEWSVLAREAHTAKSSALTFGMEETGKLLKKIQLVAQDGEFDILPELVEQASAQLEAAVPELEDFKKSL